MSVKKKTPPSPSATQPDTQEVSAALNRLTSEDKDPKPDGGYGWVILISALLISFILDGCMYSFGIVLNEIKLHYGVTQDIANLLTSLNTGFLFLSGPVSSALATQFGCRPVVMGASCVFALMYVLCAYSPSIYFTIVAFGVVGGVAFGCAYLTCFIILVDYFDKKLGIANGLTMAGSGLGAFAFAPFTKFLVSHFDWQVTMIVLGALTLQCCVLGSLLKPLDRSRSKRNSPPIDIELHNLSADAATTSAAATGTENDDSSLPWHQRVKAVKITLGIVKEMTNFKLLRTNAPYLLIVLSNFFVFLGYFIPFIYIPIRAEQLHIYNYAWILSIIGIVNIPARIGFGFICDRKIVSALTMNTMCTLVACSTLFAYYLMTVFNTQAAFAVVYAISIAGMNCLAVPYLVDMVGSKNFSNANGILNMFRGFSCIIGPYIGGFLSEKTGDIFYSFVFAGTSYGLAFLFSFLAGSIKIIQQRCGRLSRAAAENENDAVE